jgi:hypothetical protein
MELILLLLWRHHHSQLWPLQLVVVAVDIEIRQIVMPLLVVLVVAQLLFQRVTQVVLLVQELLVKGTLAVYLEVFLLVGLHLVVAAAAVLVL